MTEGIYTLKDDRKLSYAVYGPADGQPVLYFHGTPSSRKEILLLESFGVDVDRLLHESGLKLIAPDRGALTTYHPQRSFASFAGDAIELLQCFGIQKCATLCWSGGGPYALAAAHYFPHTVNAVYILCGITRQFDNPALQQMGLNKYYFLSAKHTPFLLQAALNLLRGQGTISLPGRRLTGLPEVDYTMLKKAVKEVAALTLKESIRKGARAAVHEAAMYFTPYGFSIKDLQQPVHYWWGTKDMAVVELHAQEVEQKALHPVMHYREGEGHLSLYVHCFGEALETIARDIASRSFPTQ